MNAAKILFTTALVAASGSSMALQVAGTGTGAIPDSIGGCFDWTTGPTGAAPHAGTPLTLSFAVAGLADPVASVGVRVQGTHTWVGDLTLILKAPGGTPAEFVMSDIRGTFGNLCDDDSDLGGPYNLEDIFTGNLQTAAVAAGDDVALPAGNYEAAHARTGVYTPIDLNAVFGGLAPGAANGTWTLEVWDLGPGDNGSISAATLFINEPSPVQLQHFEID